MLRKRKPRTRKRRESGQSMVEFALVLPLLLFLLAGFCDAGWILLHKMKLNNLAYTLAYLNQDYLGDSATANLKRYVKINYPNYPDPDSGQFQIQATTDFERIEYYEYTWQPNKDGGTYYRANMYNVTVWTTVELEYKVPYLTGFGKLIFGTEDNEFTVKAEASAFRLVENEAR